jgi:uncharacterized delta-60 repeat protein
LNPDGSPDATFGGTGRVRTSLSDDYDAVNALAIQSDGKILAAGYANNTSALHPADFALVRYNTDGSLDTSFDSEAFVQMEYFGYMRRNEDTSGFNFWLDKLNFYGDFITAEMVRSFLLSPEYRRRFGSQ